MGDGGDIERISSSCTSNAHECLEQVFRSFSNLVSIAHRLTAYRELPMQFACVVPTRARLGGVSGVLAIMEQCCVSVE